MEVKVSNVSKLASKDTLKSLFGIVGNILVFEHYPNVVKRDGSYECDIVYSNIREAKRAVRLNETVLGDRVLGVTLVKSPARFRLRSSPSDQLRRLYSESTHRTAILSDLPSVSTEDLMTVCGRGNVADIVMLESGWALVEFLDRPSMLLAFERLKVALLPDGSHAKIDEAWRRIDPNYTLIKEERTKSLSEKKNVSESSNSDRHVHRYSGSNSNSNYKSRSKSRSSSRGRDRRRKSRSRSRSRERGRHYTHKSHNHHHHRSRSRSRSRTPGSRRHGSSQSYRR